MPSGPTERSWAYRPHFDGLRAIAVYLVVAYHAGVGRLSNGFIGVDVFFVLSGYLVTSLLIRDLDGETGKIGFGRFYSRRARRLLPAAAVNLIITAVVFGAIAAPVEFNDAAGGIRAAALYVSNWHFIAQSADYFATDPAANPVVQYWSLSVEEQFYIVWPVLLAGLYAATRRTRVRQGVIAVAALGSCLWALKLASTNLDRAYYGTDTRAYQLLGGALLALAPGVISRLRRSPVRPVLPAVAAGAIVAIGLGATTLFSAGPVSRGVGVTALVMALLVSLEASPAGRLHGVLGWGPFAYLGRISYGTYLWHWLVIVVLGREADLSSLTTFVVATVVATGLASLSYQVLEHPIRAASALERHRPATIAVGLVVSLLVGIVIAPRVFDRARARDRSEETAAVTATAGSGTVDQAMVSAAFEDTFDYGTCEVSGPIACPVSSGKAGTAIVVGESHAGMLTPMLADLTERHDVALSAGYLSYCPWVQGLRYAGVGKDCFADQANLYDRIIDDLDPDIVFLAHRAIDDPRDSWDVVDEDQGLLKAGTKAAEAAVDQRIESLVAKLRADGRTVVMFEPIPVVAPEDNTLTCLSTSESTDSCRFVASPGPLPEESSMRAATEGDEQVVTVDMDQWVCPYLPICDPVVNDMIVKRDDNHLTVRYATSLADNVDGYLAAKGVWN